MIIASEAFREAMKSPVRVLSAEVSVVGTETAYTASDSLQSIVIKSTGYYYGTNTRSITIKLIGTDYSLLDQTLQIALGTQSTAVETISLGSFTIYDQETDLEKGVTTLKGYDQMGMLGLEVYHEGELEFPCTVAALATQIALRFGIPIATDFTELPNYDYGISEDLYANINGKTYRDILAEVAGATATLARVTMDGGLEFRPLAKTVDDEFTYSDMKKFKFSTQYGPVNAVVLARTPQEDNIAVRDEESIAENGLTEIKLANNEILDDDRQHLAQPILNASDGFSFHPSSITTVGLGWCEVGDRVKVTDNEDNTYETIITSSSLTIDGKIKEVLDSVAPAETQTDYSLAGGITSTIYNTEIKVDKQRQEIQSIVEEQSQFEHQTNANFTNITQNISSVITSVQNSGGNNLIKNSAMYALDADRKPQYWTFSETGTWSTLPSADASANGSLSGQVISLAGETVSQVVTVKPDDDSIAEADKTYYSFSCRIKKTAVGDCTVTLSDGTQGGVWTITVENGEIVNYKEYSIDAILPHSTELTVSVTTTDDAEFYITDMMLAVGSYRSQWTQANGEFSNSQVQIDLDGVTVKNNNLTGSYTRQTPQELEVYHNNRLVATLSSEEITAPTGSFTDGIGMPPIKIVPQSDGWAFVSTS